MPRPSYSLDHYQYLLDEAWDGVPLNFIEFLLLAVETLYMVDHPSECVLCGDAEDYYIVTKELWQKYGARHHHHICIGCFETRLGRKLTPEDFPDCPLNEGSIAPISDRHKDRMGKA